MQERLAGLEAMYGWPQTRTAATFYKRAMYTLFQWEGLSERVSKRALLAVTVVLVAIVLGQTGWLILYQVRIGGLEKQSAGLSDQIKQLQSRIADESIVGFLAYRHWSAIAARDLNGVMSQYAPDAKLYWLGCPLEANCTDKWAIQNQWKKFFDYSTEQYLCLNVQSFSVKTISGYHVGFTGAVVNARVSFCCPNSTYAGNADCQCPAVNYALVYLLRDGKWVLFDEWWTLPPRWHPYISY